MEGAWQTLCGSLFQKVGAQYEKARVPKEWTLGSWLSRSEDKNLRLMGKLRMDSRFFKEVGWLKYKAM